MPEPYKETIYKEKPLFNILTGINKKTGEEYWFSFGLKKAQAILEYIDAIRIWVDKQEYPHGHNDKKL